MKRFVMPPSVGLGIKKYLQVASKPKEPAQPSLGTFVDRDVDPSFELHPNKLLTANVDFHPRILPFDERVRSRELEGCCFCCRRRTEVSAGVRRSADDACCVGGPSVPTAVHSCEALSRSSHEGCLVSHEACHV